MQFLKDGPIIPEALLQAHEEGRVVFFCGAGISYPANLPSFKGLVELLYAELGTGFLEIEEAAFKREQFDTTIDLLEHRYPEQRLGVRSALPRVLKPMVRRKGALDTHVALLDLARDREGAVRLVTTNFDRIFQYVIDRDKLKVASYSAPQLPIPKRSRWDGIVYLHGLLSKDADPQSLNRLVLSSGDFGLAYLIERWAARFVGELFRNYVVCFVGYSINDPVLRYMMDALAADRMLGEISPPAYAFADYKPGEESKKRLEWDAKRVQPILYEVPAGDDRHHNLHATLKAWAATYRDGVRGKERIVDECAIAQPLTSTRQDDFVGRLLWAISDPGGLPAKRFAEFTPTPSLDWLEPFGKLRYGPTDLHLFGVSSEEPDDKTLQFCFIERPAPYTHSPWMTLFRADTSRARWDDVMLYIAKWLTNHLDDPNLVFWIIKHNPSLHPQFAAMLEFRLNEIAKLEGDGNVDALDRLRRDSPSAIPRQAMRVLWQLLLAGRVSSHDQNINIFALAARLERDGLSSSFRQSLRDALAPKVLLREPFTLRFDESQAKATERIKDIVSLEIVLSSEDVKYALADLRKSRKWSAVLRACFEDFDLLLRSALDLMHDVGEIEGQDDHSHWAMPSIDDHWQNRHFHDWTSLIELDRDAWLMILREDVARASRIAEDWWSHSYSTFKRLALFAASHPGVIPGNRWVDWLTSGDAWWLWSVETQRETMRLMVLQGRNLPASASSRLQEVILRGPPRAMFRADLEPERWTSVLEHCTWLALAKLQSGGASLGNPARETLESLGARNLDWKLSEIEQDEFPHWMSGTGDPGFLGRGRLENAPRDLQQLKAWLQEPLPDEPFHRNDWDSICRDAFSLAARALIQLSRLEIWPNVPWRDALQVWSEEALLLRSWRWIPRVLLRMPNQVMEAITYNVSWWIQAQSKIYDDQDDLFFGLCRRVLGLQQPVDEDEDFGLNRAINRPVGQVTQAVLNQWFRKQLNDDEGLRGDTRELFTLLTDTHSKHFRHGRILLATNVIALFRVDEDWTSTHLLPLFSWAHLPDEAIIMWEGFLWSPRLYRPLLSAIKMDFLATADHYAELGNLGRQYAQVLTFAALDPADTFTSTELSDATSALPQKGLDEVSDALLRAISGAGEQREAFWSNRIKPYWKAVWPKKRDAASQNIASNLARMSLMSGNAFPDALTTIRGWLLPLDHPYQVINLLNQSEQCTNHPKEALALLHSIIHNKSSLISDVRASLDAIRASWLDATDDHRYQSLDEAVRKQRY